MSVMKKAIKPRRIRSRLEARLAPRSHGRRCSVRHSGSSSYSRRIEPPSRDTPGRRPSADRSGTTTSPLRGTSVAGTMAISGQPIGYSIRCSARPPRSSSPTTTATRWRRHPARAAGTGAPRRSRGSMRPPTARISRLGRCCRSRRLAMSVWTAKGKPGAIWSSPPRRGWQSRWAKIF